MRVLYLVLVVATPALFSPSRAAAAHARGRVTERTSGKPLAGVPVRFCRSSSLAGKETGSAALVEGETTTNENGVYEFDVPGLFPRLDAVFLFTSSANHVNQVYRGQEYAGEIPLVSDFSRPGVVAVDMRDDARGIDFDLAPANRAPFHPVSRTFTAMAPMRDGTALATDVYLPEGAGPWPTVLMRTPYNKLMAAPGATNYTSRGYALVVQDTRGRFASQGTAEIFFTDGAGPLRDGYDTVEWIARQPWCNGRVGTTGGSALGLTQTMMAASAPPHLRCQHIVVAGGSIYHHVANHGGVYRQSLVDGWLRSQGFPKQAFDLLAHRPVYDERWEAMDSIAKADKVNVPAMHVGGWFDIFSQGTLDTFMAWQNLGGQRAKGNQVLVMGPWTHGVGLGAAGELRFPNARLPRAADEKTWLRYWLKGKGRSKTGAWPWRAVTFYMMGAVNEPGAPGNRWLKADAWPPRSTRQRYFLHGGKMLTRDRPTESGVKATYLFNPLKPTPTIGGPNLLIPAGPRDQRKNERRADNLVFQTAALEKPLVVAGHIRAVVYLASDAHDTDVVLRLSDVYPDGRSMLICDGALRASMRNPSRRSRAPLVPGKVYALGVDLWSTAMVFNTGHRVRLAVTSSNAPRFGVNPGSWPEGGPPRSAHNTVFMSAEYPSCLILPVLEKRRASTDTAPEAHPRKENSEEDF